MRLASHISSTLSLLHLIAAAPLAEKKYDSDASIYVSSNAATRSTTRTEIEAQRAGVHEPSYVDGRLFNIDGVTQYFAGESSRPTGYLLRNAWLTMPKAPMYGGLATYFLMTTSSTP